MKAFVVGFLCVFAVLAICEPEGYRSGGKVKVYFDGSKGYGKGGYGNGYSSGGYGGPKSSAVDALKSSYNNQYGYNYNFGYDINDYVYGNQQSRHESGSSDPKGTTKGSYSVVEPDGSRRTVNYVADWVNGFRATVSDKNGVTQHGYNSGGYGGSDKGYGGSYGGSSGGYSSSSKGYGSSSSGYKGSAISY